MVSFKKGEIMKSFNEWLETRFSPEEIDSELQALEPIRQQIKKDAMVYHLGRKKEVAKAFGVDWRVFDLPFSKWDPISAAWYRGDMKEVRKLAAELGIRPAHGVGSGDEYDVWYNRHHPGASNLT
jgi:hypothetical protein